MSWFKVDDRLPSHRKVLAIKRGTRRLAAVGAWTLMGAWCSGNGTDGVIPEDVVVDDLGVPRAVLADLLATGRILELPDRQYQVHDFLDYNPTAEKVAADRHAAAERQRLARERRASESQRTSRVTSTVTGPVTNGEVTGPVTPTPTRPDPTRSSLREEDTQTKVNTLARQTPSEFDRWWSVYPRKVAKEAARKAYAKARKQTDADTLGRAAVAFRDDPTRDDAYTPHPATWLNEGRWQDEGPARPASQTHAPDRIAFGDRVLQDAMHRAQNGTPAFGLTPLRALPGGS